MGNNFWGFGEVVFWINLYKPIFSANLKLGYRSDWPVSSITFSQGPGTQPGVKYTAVSANDQKELLQVNYSSEHPWVLRYLVAVLLT